MESGVNKPEVQSINKVGGVRVTFTYEKVKVASIDVNHVP